MYLLADERVTERKSYSELSRAI
ncbi:uncharacterized protein G2W53_029724 [Senna tora]|uniref:Uncharacterized protein n=1 Tax=Senna tora TaxID=362788 RepID=A0A834T5A2_9FABA|nr:uncharacterized protein G2W53_029724 [Senna tora]